jgi:hypothetical protein
MIFPALAVEPVPVPLEVFSIGELNATPEYSVSTILIWSAGPDTFTVTVVSPPLAFAQYHTSSQKLVTLCRRCPKLHV